MAQPNKDDTGDSYSLSALEANGKSLLILLPTAGIYCAVYVMLWGWEKMRVDFTYMFSHLEILLPSAVAGIVLHELLHAWAWMAASGLGWDSMTFGFNLRALSPYAHCNEPMSAGAYRVGVLIPGLLLGVIPFVTGMVFGSGFLSVFGFLFTLVAAGDFLMLWIIRDISTERRVTDHPSRVGCTVKEDI